MNNTDQNLQTLNIEITLLKPNANMPKYMHEGDAGLDLTSAENISIKPLTHSLIHCGFSIAIPQGYCGLVLPRSGLAAKHGITVLNTPGLIDSGYRGEICVILYNTSTNTTFDVKTGDRIAQLLIMNYPYVNLDAISSLDDTSRGSQGFGSSGI
jgi:dUTP pyrophosphatase